MTTKYLTDLEEEEAAQAQLTATVDEFEPEYEDELADEFYAGEGFES